MKKLLKKSLIVALSLCAAGMFCAFTACSNDSGQYSVGEEYVYNFDNPLRAESDAFMCIDGKLDEEIWQEQNFLEWYSTGGLIKATTIFTEKGLYVGAIAEDSTVYWGARHIYYRDTNTGQQTNSNFYIQIAKDDEVNWNDSRYNQHPANVYDFNIDALYSLSKRERRYDAKGYCDGTLNGETKSLSVELFVPWSEMGLTEIPEKIRALIQYKDTDAAGYPGFTDDGWYKTYYTYDKNGSTLYLDSNDSVGSAVEGECATDRWTIDDQNKVATTEENRTQILFMRKDSQGNNSSKATNYVAEVTIKSNTTSSAYAGLFTLTNKTNFSLYTINTYDLKSSGVAKITTGVSMDGAKAFFTYGVRNLNAGEANSDGSVRLKLVKDGGYLYYFVNDVFYAKEYVERVKGVVQIGLFSNGPVELSDWTYTSFDNGDKTVKDYLAESGFVFVELEKSGSGTVNVNDTAILKGSELNITAIANRRYAVSSLYVNGVDKTQEYYKNSVNGMFTLENVQENVIVNVEFDRVTADKWIDVSLQLKVGNEVLSTEAQYFVQDDNGELFYSGKSNADGTIRLYLLKAGTYSIGDKTISVSGSYTVNATYGDYELLEESKTFTLNETSDTFEKDIVFEKSPIGSVTVNGVNVVGQGSFIVNSDGTYQNDADFTFRQQYLTESVMKGDYVVNADVSVLNEISGMASGTWCGSVVGIVIASGSGSTKYVEIKTCNWEQGYGQYICVKIGGYEVSLGGFPAQDSSGKPIDRFGYKDNHFRFTVKRFGDALYVYNYEGVLGFIITPNGIVLANSTLRSGHETKFANINKQFAGLFDEEQVLGLYYVANGIGNYHWDVKWNNDVEVDVGSYKINTSTEFNNNAIYKLSGTQNSDGTYSLYSKVSVVVSNLTVPTYGYYLKYSYPNGKTAYVSGTYERYKRQVEFTISEGSDITLLSVEDKNFQTSVTVNGETLIGTNAQTIENVNMNMNLVTHNGLATIYDDTVATGDYMVRFKLNTSEVAAAARSDIWAGFRVLISSGVYLDIFSGYDEGRPRMSNGLYLRFTVNGTSKDLLLDSTFANLSSKRYSETAEDPTMDLMLVRKGNALALYYYTRYEGVDSYAGNDATWVTSDTWEILFAITFDDSLESGLTTTKHKLTTSGWYGFKYSDQVISTAIPVEMGQRKNVGDFPAIAESDANKFWTEFISIMKDYMQAGSETAFAFRQEYAQATNRYYSIEVTDDDAAVASFVANGENNKVSK